MLMIMGLGLMTMSCSNDNDEGFPGDSPTALAQVSLKAKGTYNGATAKGFSSTTLKGNVEISNFLVNIGEIELEFDDDSDDDSWEGDDFYGSDDELELKGPFELDLVQNEFTFAVVDLPQARFEELEFEFSKNGNEASALYGKTILVQGNLDGMPFEFWHNFEEDMEIDYQDSTKDIDITNGLDEITINFDLSGMLSGLDLSTAVDGNGDGLIEISPMDVDGNNALAKALKERIKDYIDLLDD